MAILTRNLLYAESGSLIVNYDYDDVDLDLLSIEVINLTNHSYTITATSTSASNKKYTIDGVPGTTVQVVPPGQENRMHLTVTPSGKLDGVEWSIY